LEAASIYLKSDDRYKLYPQHINPMIENELVKHKVSIEELFMESEINNSYTFLRANIQPKRISLPGPKNNKTPHYSGQAVIGGGQ
jgi:hypothetical protein